MEWPLLLGSTWRAAIADEGLRRSFLNDGFDDSLWVPVSVPGHWRHTPAFSATDGPVLYRRAFEAPGVPEGTRAWLTFEGVFYDGDVWLDGSYVGTTEGYFFPHTFEITSHLTPSSPSEHVLGVEVGCPGAGGAPTKPAKTTGTPSGGAATGGPKRALTGVFQGWADGDPAWNPGGIWRPVHISTTGPVRISSLRVLCAEATAERAQLDVRAVLDAAASGSAVLSVTVSAPDGTVVADRTSRHNLAHGDNRIRIGLAVDQPDLWWPRALGAQTLHTIAVAVSIDEEPSDERRLVTGLRQVRMTNWIMTVNGERLFLKGFNLAPADLALADPTAARFDDDLRLAAEAGLDLLRVHGHISRPELYDAADRAGILLWQDLPLHGATYARNVRKQAVRQAREAVDLLGHHPSIALWCGHALFEGAESKRILRQELPTWNKTFLDTSIGRALERADPSRPVIRHSGLWPGAASGGTDSHLYFGWRQGAVSDLSALLARLPSMGRFVSEFGAQAVPTNAFWMEPHRWPALDAFPADLEAFERHVPPESYEDFDAWQAATQAYQAGLLKSHIETLRRLKYRPTGGFCQYFFADSHPAVSFSILDHSRAPKAGYAAVTAACAPVIVVADFAATHPTLEASIHVVSDLRVALPSARVTATAGGHTWGWEGAIPADSCTYVGTVRTPADGGALALTLTAGDVGASNEYEPYDHR